MTSPSPLESGPTTEAERRSAAEQALANSRIEGHHPSAEHLANMEAWVKGTMSTEEGVAAALARAMANDVAATTINTSEAERRFAAEQALAATRISGHRPTPEFLVDMEAVIRGDMTNEQARAASLARAKAADARAPKEKP